MSTAAIVKACVILMGNWNYDRYLRASCEKEADRKPGSYLGTAWNCSNLKRSGSEIFRMEQPDRAWGASLFFLITALLVLWGVYQMTIQISSLLMKNQELAILVSLLNQENERILRELEKLTGKNAREL
mgnify:CR=1 FL=1